MRRRPVALIPISGIRRTKEYVSLHSKVGFLSYSAYPCLRAIQWPWSSALIVGLVHDNLDQTMVCFWVTFWFQNCSSGTG